MNTALDQMRRGEDGDAMSTGQDLHVRTTMKPAPNTLLKKLAVLVMVASVMTVGMTGTASADVVNGQFVSKRGLRCGGQERITGSTSFTGGILQQHSWIYYNCSSRTLRRKADIKFDRDGRCYGIGPGQARVIAIRYAFPRDVYRGSKAC